MWTSLATPQERCPVHRASLPHDRRLRFISLASSLTRWATTEWAHKSLVLCCRTYHGSRSKGNDGWLHSKFEAASTSSVLSVQSFNPNALRKTGDTRAAQGMDNLARCIAKTDINALSWRFASDPRRDRIAPIVVGGTRIVLLELH